MGGVLAEATARQDILIRRRASTDVGIRWIRSTDGGHLFGEVDVEGDTGTVELRGPDGALWLEKPVEAHPGGLVVIRFSPDDFTAPVWASRSGGSWLCTLSHDDRVERLGEGYFHLED